MDRRSALALVPVLAVVVMVILSSQSSPGAPALPRPVTAEPKTDPVAGVGPAFTVPARVPDDAPLVTAPRWGNESDREVAAADRSATIRAYRGQRQPWETTAPGSTAGIPGVPASGAAAAAALPASPDQVAEAGVDVSDQVGGGSSGSLVVLLIIVAVICCGAGLAFRRRPLPTAGAQSAEPLEVLVS